MRVAPKLRAVVMHSTMFNSGEAGNWFFEVSRADVGTQFGWLVRACVRALFRAGGPGHTAGAQPCPS